MFGSHLNKAWSATQAFIALSSGEAEYYGVVRGTGSALGIQVHTLTHFSTKPVLCLSPAILYCIVYTPITPEHVAASRRVNI